MFIGIGLLLVAVQGGMVRPFNARFGRARLPSGWRSALNVVGLLLLAARHQVARCSCPALALLVLGQGCATPTIARSWPTGPQDSGEAVPSASSSRSGALARIVGPAVAGLLFEHVGVAAPYVVGRGRHGARAGAPRAERDLPASTPVTNRNTPLDNSALKLPCGE